MKVKEQRGTRGKSHAPALWQHRPRKAWSLSPICIQLLAFGILDTDLMWPHTQAKGMGRLSFKQLWKHCFKETDVDFD